MSYAAIFYVWRFHAHQDYNPNKNIEPQPYLRKPPPGAVDHLADRRGGGAAGGAGGPGGRLGAHASGLGPGLAALFPGAGVECAHRRRRAAGADAAPGPKSSGLEPPRRHLEGRGRRGSAPAGPGRGEAGFCRLRVSGRHPRHRGRRRCASTPGPRAQSLAGVLKRVWVATPQLQLLELTPAELGLGYRTSSSSTSPTGWWWRRSLTWRTPPGPRPSRPAWRN